MGRIRTIKPEFWLSETQGSIPREIRMLAAALLNHSDDDGYFRAHPALVAGACCPYDEDGREFVTRAMGELRRIGYIEVSEDGRVGRVVNFKENQRISHPAPSKLGKDFKASAVPPEDVRSERGEPAEDVYREVEVEQGSGSGTGKQSSTKTGASHPPPSDSFELSGQPRAKQRKRSEAQQFRDWAELERTKKFGFVAGPDPDPAAINSWFKRVLCEVSLERLQRGWARYLLKPADDYWATRQFPFAGFMDDNGWRKYVPPEERAA